MELHEKDIAKLMKAKGFCINHSKIPSEFMCCQCKNTICFLCKKDHESKMPEHKIFNYIEDGFARKEKLMKSMGETSNDEMELLTVELLNDLTKRFKAIIKEFEIDLLKMINYLKECAVSKKKNEEQKKDKEKIEKLQNEGKFLELYLFCIEASKRQSQKTNLQKSTSYEQIIPKFVQIKEKICSNLSGIEKLFNSLLTSKATERKQNMVKEDEKTVQRMKFKEFDQAKETKNTINEFYNKIKKNTHFTMVLSSNNLNDDDAIAIADALKTNAIITKFFMNNNNICENGAIAISDAIKTNTKITVFNINNNEIREGGAHTIAEALKSNTTLTKINISSNHIGDKGAFAIAEALKINSTIAKLYIQCNEISEKGVFTIAEALKKNKTLAKINLSCNNIKDKGASAVAETFKTNTTLTSIDISWNNIGDSGASAIVRALKTNASIAKLFIGCNKIGEKGVDELQNAALARSNLKIDFEDRMHKENIPK